jgi:hypothetical protein
LTGRRREGKVDLQTAEVCPMADWTAEKTLWSVPEIAARLRCHPSTVRLWCEQGLLAAGKLSAGRNSHWKVAAGDLRAFVRGPDATAA